MINEFETSNTRVLEGLTVRRACPLDGNLACSSCTF